MQATSSQTLSHLWSLCRPVWPPLPIHLQLRWTQVARVNRGRKQDPESWELFQDLSLHSIELTAFVQESWLVPCVHSVRRCQLLDHHLLRDLLHQRGRLEAALCHRPHRGSHLLRTWLASLRLHCKSTWWTIMASFSQEVALLVPNPRTPTYGLMILFPVALCCDEPDLKWDVQLQALQLPEECAR